MSQNAPHPEAIMDWHWNEGRAALTELTKTVSFSISLVVHMEDPRFRDCPDETPSKLKAILVVSLSGSGRATAMRVSTILDGLSHPGKERVRGALHMLSASSFTYG